MDYKIQVLHEMIDKMNQDPYTFAKLKCGDGKTLSMGIYAIEALINHFEKITDCKICPDANMCDQVRYDCPKWSE